MLKTFLSNIIWILSLPRIQKQYLRHRLIPFIMSHILLFIIQYFQQLSLFSNGGNSFVINISNATLLRSDIYTHLHLDDKVIIARHDNTLETNAIIIMLSKRIERHTDKSSSFLLPNLGKYILVHLVKACNINTIALSFQHLQE